MGRPRSTTFLLAMCAALAVLLAAVPAWRALRINRVAALRQLEFGQAVPPIHGPEPFVRWNPAGRPLLCAYASGRR
jgi:hypothetical protein